MDGGKETITVTKRVWRAAVVLGRIEGYRPSPSVDDVRAMIEAHESVTVGEAWPYYLDWAIRQVDEGYAAGLAQGLGKAEARWVQAKSGDESLIDRFTLMRLTREEVSALQRLGEWFRRGGCEVRWHRDGDVDLFREAAA